MKKLNLLLTGVLSATLLLGACSNEDTEKKEDSKKSESVEKKNEAPEKEEKAKETEESTEVTEPATAIIPAHQETVEQSTAQEEPAPVEQQEAPVQEQQQAEPTEQEKMEANKEWAKENIKGGTDAGMLDSSMQADGYYSNDQLDPDTGLPKDDAVPHKNGEGPMAESEQEAEPSEWVKGQDEWNNASESERVEMQKESARLNGDEYDPKDFEVE